MVKDSTSPFTPGRPVPLPQFVGRSDEVERLRRKIRDSVAAQRVEVAFVTGERGMGKSSLASFVRYLGERDLKVVGIHAMMGGVHTVESAVKQVFDELLKEQAAGSYFEKLKELFGKHVKSVGLWGATVEFDASESELRSLAGNFGQALRNVLIRMERDGLVLILDDINGLAQSLDFANWFKSLVDGVSLARERFPLTIMLVGLEERRRSMIERQPSVARIFDVVEIRAWSNPETRKFFDDRFRQVGIAVAEGVWNALLEFTGGLPVLAHEIGDAAFHVDRDERIDDEDARVAILNAAEVVGRKYLDPVVFQSIRSRKYRSILHTMAQNPVGMDFTRAQLKKQVAPDEEKVLDNFLHKMKDLGVVVTSAEGERGAYRFCNLLHNLYFYLEAQRAQGVEDQ